MAPYFPTESRGPSRLLRKPLSSLKEPPEEGISSLPAKQECLLLLRRSALKNSLAEIKDARHPQVVFCHRHDRQIAGRLVYVGQKDGAVAEIHRHAIAREAWLFAGEDAP